MTNQYNELSFSDAFKIILKNKLIVVLTTITFGIGSIFYALSLDNIYKSEVLLEVTESESSFGGVASSFGNIASFAGLGNLSQVAKDDTSVAFELIKSKNLVKILNKHDWIIQGVMASKSYDPISKELNYDEKLFFDNTWIRKVDPPYSIKPSYLEVFKTLNDGVMSVAKDSKTGFIKLSISHQSPVFAKELIDQIVFEINEYRRSQDLETSAKSLEYLKMQLDENPVNEVRKSINELIKMNMEIQMFANINENYFIKPIDGPHISEFKISPTRSIICISITLFGFILSILISLIRHTFFKSSY